MSGKDTSSSANSGSGSGSGSGSSQSFTPYEVKSTGTNSQVSLSHILEISIDIFNRVTTMTLALNPAVMRIITPTKVSSSQP